MRNENGNLVPLFCIFCVSWCGRKLFIISWGGYVRYTSLIWSKQYCTILTNIQLGLLIHTMWITFSGFIEFSLFKSNFIHKLLVCINITANPTLGYWITDPISNKMYGHTICLYYINLVKHKKGESLKFSTYILHWFSQII